MTPLPFAFTTLFWGSISPFIAGSQWTIKEHFCEQEQNATRPAKEPKRLNNFWKITQQISARKNWGNTPSACQPAPVHRRTQWPSFPSLGSKNYSSLRNVSMKRELLFARWNVQAAILDLNWTFKNTRGRKVFRTLQQSQERLSSDPLWHKQLCAAKAWRSRKGNNNSLSRSTDKTS